MSSIARKRRRPNNGSSRKDLQHHKLIKSVDSFVKSVANFDLRITKKCSVCARPTSSFGNLRPLMKLLEITCHFIPWFLGSLVLLMMVHKQSHIELLLNILIALLADLALVGIIKYIFQRPRPAHNKMDMFATVSVDHYSFPSGHTTRAAMMAFLLAERLVINSTFPGLMYLWSVFVSMSRIMLGRHHVSDVVAGYLIGIGEYSLSSRYWVPEEICMWLLEPLFSHMYH